MHIGCPNDFQNEQAKVGAIPPFIHESISTSSNVADGADYTSSKHTFAICINKKQQSLIDAYFSFLEELNIPVTLIWYNFVET